MPIVVALAKERAQHLTKPLSARVSTLSYPGAPAPELSPDPETRDPPSSPAVHSTSTPPLDIPPIDTLTYLDSLNDELESGDDDEDRGHGLPKPPPPDSDEENGDEDNNLGHGPPPPLDSDDESMVGGRATPSESDDDDEPELSPIRKRPIRIRPDSDEEEDWGLKTDPLATPSTAPAARPKTKKAVGWRTGSRAQQCVRRDRMQRINAELAAFQLKHKKKEEKLVQKLAKKYDVRVGAVETKLVGAKQWKTKRAASERKVLTGYYCRLVNAERAAEEKPAISFFTAQARVAKKPELIQFSPEVKAKVMDEYAARQKLKTTGKRGTALGTARDVNVTTKKLAEDFSNLRKRTNTISFSLVAPIDPHNSFTVPTVLDGGGARYMFERHGMTETEGGQRLRKMGFDGSMSLRELQNFCRVFITRGLAKVAQKPTRMNYDNYCSKILSIHAVHLVGWPNDCPWRSPGEIKKPIPLRSLAKAIEKKECYWRVVESDSELEELEKEYAELVSQGLRPKPTGHKTRSDKGSTRGKQTKKRKQAVEDESDGGVVDAADSVAKNRGRRTTTASSRAGQKKKPATTTSRRKRTHNNANDSDDGQTDGSNNDTPPKKKRSKQSASGNDDGRQTGKKAKHLGNSASKRAGMPPATSEAYRRLREQRQNSKPKPKPKQATVQPAAATPTTQPSARPKPKPRVKAAAPAEGGKTMATPTATTPPTAGAQSTSQTATTPPTATAQSASQTATTLQSATAAATSKPAAVRKNVLIGKKGGPPGSAPELWPHLLEALPAVRTLEVELLEGYQGPKAAWGNLVKLFCDHTLSPVLEEMRVKMDSHIQPDHLWNEFADDDRYNAEARDWKAPIEYGDLSEMLAERRGATPLRSFRMAIQTYDEHAIWELDDVFKSSYWAPAWYPTAAERDQLDVVLIKEDFDFVLRVDVDPMHVEMLTSTTIPSLLERAAPRNFPVNAEIGYYDDEILRIGTCAQWPN
ncbi:hypothetical protein C8F01DRAFT_1257191 [Mycena amicta]|nr:hypothetical protein C8F01DRAFT_1257191 [Mycena amicta]